MQKKALLIGINGYKPGSGIPALKYAECDAAELGDVLSERCGFECETLLGPDASRNRILKALEGAGSGELFLFFFAGHGIHSSAGSHLLTSNSRIRMDVSFPTKSPYSCMVI